MRLIDADELKIDYGFTWSDITPTHDELYELINRQPTIDAVPVVRCRECKYHSDRQCYHPNHEHHEQSVWVEENHYCSWGQRRKDGDRDG